jgi:L-amino acid N-acyltransferase YncA
LQARLRPAEAADAASIAAIYREAVLHGTASFELEPPDPTEITRRMATLAAGGFPFWVADAAVGEGPDGEAPGFEATAAEVLGYAYAGPYRARPAYRFTVETSIYLSERARGHGLGTRLLLRLIEACEAAGARQLVAVIGDSANHASIALHRACGFHLVGVLASVGWKHGRWLDSVLMQRALGPGAQSPPDDADGVRASAKPSNRAVV